jgi:hypothetical protein
MKGERKMTMTRTERTIAALLALGAAIALTLALTAPARAATYGNGFQLAKFKVEIKGTSHTTWHRNYEAEDECGVSDHSFGRERLSFRSTRPVVITASHMPGQFNPQLFAGRSALGIPVRATVQRSFTPAISSPPAECEENGGGAEASKPDCGTRSVRGWHLDLEFSDKKKNGFQVHSDSHPKNPYLNCPGSLYNYPFLLDEQGRGNARKPLYADLSQDEIFDPEFQKWITIGNGSFEEISKTWRTDTDVHWAVSFTRIGEKKKH